MGDLNGPEDVKRREIVREVQHGGQELHERIVEDVNAENRMMIFRIDQLVWLVFGALVATIGLRVILKLFAADPNNPFASLVYSTTDLFLWPFQGLVITPTADGMVFEISSIIAIFVYLLLGWGFSKLIWILFYKPSTKTVTTYERRDE